MLNKKLILKSVLFGTICGILFAVILMCLFSAVILSVGLMPGEIMNYAALGILSLGALFGGIVTSKISKSAGLIAGMLTGLTMFVLITIIGLTKSNDAVTFFTLLKLIASLIFGSAGGIIGLHKKERIKIK